LAKQGTVPSEGQYAAIDTRFHVLNGLQAITNHDAGRNGEDWRPWYARPGSGLQIPKYQLQDLQTNALRTLQTVPSETAVRLAKALSASNESADRRATVAALERVDGAARAESR